ncbi:hypothetical protein MOV66_24090 [Agrobacterium sp. SHOUNA12C]|nr:hypothetical protein [Agrobacterium sp. BETTINA12B]MCJ9759745.1 hypothetical protein [Agrobacterium sp. SHOUNA12C]
MLSGILLTEAQKKSPLELEKDIIVGPEEQLVMPAFRIVDNIKISKYPFAYPDSKFGDWISIGYSQLGGRSHLLRHFPKNVTSRLR